MVVEQVTEEMVDGEIKCLYDSANHPTFCPARPSEPTPEEALTQLLTSGQAMTGSVREPLVVMRMSLNAARTQICGRAWRACRWAQYCLSGSDPLQRPNRTWSTPPRRHQPSKISTSSGDLMAVAASLTGLGGTLLSMNDRKGSWRK